MPAEIRDVLVILGAALGSYCGAHVNKAALRKIVSEAIATHVTRLHLTRTSERNDHAA